MTRYLLELFSGEDLLFIRVAWNLLKIIIGFGEMQHKKLQRNEP